jgi:putative serine protease PepD
MFILTFVLMGEESVPFFGNRDGNPYLRLCGRPWKHRGISKNAAFRLMFFALVAVFFLSLTESTVAKTKGELNNIDIYKKTAPGVVNIASVVVKHDFFYRPIPQEGTGSGAVIDKRGYIVTNSHVIQNAQAIEVTFYDGSKWPAKLIGTDPDNDLAVIKVAILDRELTVIAMGTSKDLEVGQKVLAIGNPFGLSQTLTTGTISSIGRNIRTDTGTIIKNVVQTDAAINPGNSGGPLLNSRGEMIGINAAILSPTGANVGIGFGIPVDKVKSVIPRLISGKFSYYGLRPVLFFGLVLLAIYLVRGLVRRRQGDT